MSVQGCARGGTRIFESDLAQGNDATGQAGMTSQVMEIRTTARMPGTRNSMPTSVGDGCAKDAQATEEDQAADRTDRKRCRGPGMVWSSRWSMLAQAGR
jgi:hypothetical protein